MMSQHVVSRDASLLSILWHERLSQRCDGPATVSPSNHNEWHTRGHTLLTASERLTPSLAPPSSAPQQLSPASTALVCGTARARAVFAFLRSPLVATADTVTRVFVRVPLRRACRSLLPVTRPRVTMLPTSFIARHTARSVLPSVSQRIARAYSAMAPVPRPNDVGILAMEAYVPKR